MISCARNDSRRDGPDLHKLERSAHIEATVSGGVTQRRISRAQVRTDHRFATGIAHPHTDPGKARRIDSGHAGNRCSARRTSNDRLVVKRTGRTLSDNRKRTHGAGNDFPYRQRIRNGDRAIRECRGQTGCSRALRMSVRDPSASDRQNDQCVREPYSQNIACASTYGGARNSGQRHPQKCVSSMPFSIPAFAGSLNSPSHLPKARRPEACRHPRNAPESTDKLRRPSRSASATRSRSGIAPP